MFRRKAIKPITTEKIIEDLAIGSLSQAEISKKHKVFEAAVSLIKKSLKNIIPLDLKRKRNESIVGLSETLHRWFLKIRIAAIPITGEMLKQKAKDIAIGLGRSDFQASNGWLEKWLDYYKISLKRLKRAIE